MKYQIESLILPNNFLTISVLILILVRKERNMETLKIIPIDLIDHPDPKPIEEAKISSSTNRIRLLGTLFNPVKPNDNIPKSPYIIGLTGKLYTKIVKIWYLISFPVQ